MYSYYEKEFDRLNRETNKWRSSFVDRYNNGYTQPRGENKSRGHYDGRGQYIED